MFSGGGCWSSSVIDLLLEVGLSSCGGRFGGAFLG